MHSLMSTQFPSQVVYQWKYNPKVKPVLTLGKSPVKPEKIITSVPLLKRSQLKSTIKQQADIYNKQKTQLAKYLKGRQNFRKDGTNIYQLLFDSYEMWKNQPNYEHVPVGRRDRTKQRVMEYQGKSSQKIRSKLKEETRLQQEMASSKALQLQKRSFADKLNRIEKQERALILKQNEFIRLYIHHVNDYYIKQSKSPLYKPFYEHEEEDKHSESLSPNLSSYDLEVPLRAGDSIDQSGVIIKKAMPKPVRRKDLTQR